MAFFRFDLWNITRKYFPKKMKNKAITPSVVDGSSRGQGRAHSLLNNYQDGEKSGKIIRNKRSVSVLLGRDAEGKSEGECRYIEMEVIYC